MITRIGLALAAAAILSSGPEDLKQRQLQVSSTKTFNVPGFEALGLPLDDGDHPRILLASSDSATNIPGFGYYDFAKSDSAGNMYVHPTQGYTPAPVLRISASTSVITAYNFPAELRDKVNVLDFGVTPFGGVWVLTDSADHSETVAFAFDSKGEVRSRTNFSLPPGVNIYSFLVSNSESLLLSGTYGQMAVKELQGQPYVALFDRSGNLLRALHNVTDRTDLAQMGSVPQENGSAVGEDGSFYLLDAKQVTVLNPAGEIDRRIPVSKPAPDLRMAGIYVSGGLAAIRLARLRKDHTVTFNYMVINLSSKQTLGWYVGDPSIGDNAVGFSRAEGFTFSHMEKGVIHLIRAPLR